MGLERVERELGEGCGEVGGLRRALHLRDRDGGDGGGQGQSQGEGERVLQKTKLWGLLDARKVWLRESTVAQLEDGFERAFRVDLAPPSASSSLSSSSEGVPAKAVEKGMDGGKGGNRVAGRGGRGEEEGDDNDNEDGWGLDDDADDDDDVDSKMVIDDDDDDDENEERGNEETHQPQQDKQFQRQRLYCRIELAGEHHGVPLRVVTCTCVIVFFFFPSFRLFVLSRCVALRCASLPVVSENEYANHPPTRSLYPFFSFLVNQPPPPSTYCDSLP